jgi:hypothetical protein
LILGVLATVVENCKNLDHFGGCEEGCLFCWEGEKKEER